MRILNAEFVLSATKPSHYPPADAPEVAFAGRSNCGKSSLLNTLVGRRQMARVSRTPGRTQLINFFRVEIERGESREPMSLVDLPGYGYAKVPLRVRREWGPMMERYVVSRASLLGMVVLLDIRREPSDEDRQLFDALARLELPSIVALTKSDKLSKSQRFVRRKAIAKSLGVQARHLVVTSSHTGLGREALLDAMGSLLGMVAPEGELEEGASEA